ncbi:MAG: serine/threonine-protein phosphatase, partial [Oligoflexia bacterium]|nr:serine/threonine-protein phosphatase [Oligoflexia bacterium]
MDAKLEIGTTCTVGIGGSYGGRCRNEDNFLVAQRGSARLRDDDGAEVVRQLAGHGIMLAVADGMGGHDHGDVASAAAVQALAKLWQQGRPEDPEHVLLDWVPSTHKRIRKVLARSGTVNMGTTLTTLWIVGDHLGWVHVGDSRLYRLRDGVLTRITHDQTHAEFAHRDHRDPGPNATYPAQNFIFGSRGLGEDGGLRLDPGMDTGTLDLALGDRLLLCTDGICGFLGDQRIASILSRARSAQEAAEDLVDVAMECGSDDNLTAIVAQV